MRLDYRWLTFRCDILYYCMELTWLFRYAFCLFQGYELGDKAVGILIGAQGKAIRKAIATIAVWLLVVSLQLG